MKTTVRVITWNIESLQKQFDKGIVPKFIENVDEMTGKLFRKDGSTTRVGSALLRNILDSIVYSGRARDGLARRTKEVTVEVVCGWNTTLEEIKK